MVLTEEQRARRVEVADDLATGATMYELLGGAPTLRTLVDHFYDIMESDPRIKPVRDMHKADLGPMRVGLFEFLSGWLGGPNLYVDKHGSPCLTGVHMGYAIDDHARDLWVECMQRAMELTEVPLKYIEVIMPPLADMADHMRVMLPEHQH